MPNKRRNSARGSRKSVVVIPDGSHSAEAANILAHEDPNATAAQHRQTLLKAFEEMDEDGSGQIDVKELGRLKPPTILRTRLRYYSFARCDAQSTRTRA